MEPTVSRRIANVDAPKHCLRAPICPKATTAIQTIMCADAQKLNQHVLVIVPVKWDNVLVGIHFKLEFTQSIYPFHLVMYTNISFFCFTSVSWVGMGILCRKDNNFR